MNVFILMAGDEWDGREDDLKAVYTNPDRARTAFATQVRTLATARQEPHILALSDAEITDRYTQGDGSLRLTVGDDYVSLREHTTR